jgi:hypothetical protein
MVGMLVIDRREECGIRWDVSVHKNEDRLFSREFNPFANDINKLSHCEIRWDQVFLLVNVWNP